METQTTPSQTPADRAGAVKDESKQAAQNVAGTAGQEAKNVTREASDQVRQLWGQTRSDLTDQAATQQTRVAGGLRELADQLGSMAQGADSDGMAKGLVDDVARRAGDAATWLDQRDPGSLLDEVRTFARQRPGAFLAIAAGVGVLAGRMSRSLVDEARDSDDSSSTDFGGSTGAQFADTNGGATYGTSTYGSTGYAAGTTGGYGEGFDTVGTNGGTGMPITPGATTATAAEGGAALPGDELSGAHRTSQPFAPDGTPTPIDDEGFLTTAEADDSLRGNR
jgi:hypothetical protein